MSDISILVVDDEQEIADLVEIYLVSDGYRVFKAQNAEEGLRILREEEIHLVLLDIMMPGMDGIQMCKRIREKSNIIRSWALAREQTTMLRSPSTPWSLPPE